jgi:putative aldouronate transport system substrate-binding protein
MKKFEQTVCAVLAAAVILAGGVSCKKNDVPVLSDVLEKGEISYPVKTGGKLTYWVRLVPALGGSVKNFAETPFAKEYMKRTGIEVEYLHPTQNQETESLNLLIASGDLPDIIETNWLDRNPDSAIEKNTITKLNDLIKYYAPNLAKYLSENPDIDRAVKADSGSYYVFPFIRGDELLLSTAGFMLRADWLAGFGLEAPETISEWEAVLDKFKSKTEYPLAMNMSNLNYFAGAFGISTDFYIDGENVRYGANDPEYRDFLALMNKWYTAGYIDKSFSVLDYKIINANMLEGKSGASFGAGGGMMGSYLKAMESKDPEFNLAAAKFPASEKGVKPEFGNKQLPYSPYNCGAVSGKSKNAALAARYLDYSYTKEGHLLNNFGIEGKSYSMVNGVPAYTGFVTKNPENKSMAQVLPLYVRSVNEGPFVQDKGYIEQYYELAEQRDALKIWTDNSHEKHAMPQITLTQDEASEFNKIMSDIKIYKEENTLNFIIGAKPVSDFDAYINGLEQMKIDRAVEIQQAAYNRFLSRK